MNITTKYDVGYTFWVPRVAKRYKNIEIYHEGHIWRREVSYFEAYVKQKKITEISIDVTFKDTFIKYCVSNIDDIDLALPSIYNESQITNYSESEAKYIASQYANREKEYFGS